MVVSLPWKTWVAAALLLGAAVFLWNRERRLRGDAQRDAEDARLTLKNQIVEHEANRGELRADKDKLLEENATLRAAYDLLAESTPGSQPVSASRLDTGPLVVHVAPRRQVPPAAVKAPQVTTPPVEPAGPSCVVSETDSLSVEVDLIEVSTKAGNTAVAGTAAVYRQDPPPRELLAIGSFKSSLSTSTQLEVPRAPRWGLLALGACGSQGCGPGLGALLPAFTVPLVHWQAEAFLGAVAAPGAALALGGVGVRW